MRAWLPAVAAGAVVAIAAMVIVLSLRPGPAASGAERADALAAELRCPDCQGLSVADSPTQSATEIRRQIDELVAAGATDDEVRSHFVARYGEWIRLAPSSAALWLIPFAVVAAAALGLGAWLIRRPPSPAPAAAHVSAGARARIHEEAEALDA
jgi:cytochrome c-type biogenesis protein CcmH